MNKNTMPLNEEANKQIHTYVYENFHTYYSLHKLNIMPLAELSADLRRGLEVLPTTIQNDGDSLTAFSEALAERYNARGYYTDLFTDTAKAISYIMEPAKEMAFPFLTYKNLAGTPYVNNLLVNRLLQTSEETKKEGLHALGFHALDVMEARTYIYEIQQLMLDLTDKLDNLPEESVRELHEFYSIYQGFEKRSLGELVTLESPESARDLFVGNYNQRIIEPAKDVIQSIIKPMIAKQSEGVSTGKQAIISDSIDGV